ncbi:PIG-L deacetylase family protein [Sphingomonas sp. ac-8]|uniref:PIG-L deacetylase family protein n=1 Tax=Sphingomonas sp. ac-8 TaxID=3242977 RepID=UPI003A7FC61A
MRCDPFAARRAWVVAPHPDDETIGAWALMRRLARGGAQIWVAVVSDGGASHPGSRSWPPARLIRARRRETLRAMATLGLAPSRVRFLDLPDGALEPERVRRSLGRALHRMPAPELIVGPVPDDAHGDHRAVAAALRQLPRRGAHRLGYRVWPAEPRIAAKGPHVRLDGSAMTVKRRVVRSYRTQAGAIADSATGFTMTPRHLRAFVRPDERFVVLA